MKNPTWYEGAVQHVPSTNNALEATNKSLKVITQRDRLPLGQFISVMNDIIGQYSRRSITDLVYTTEADITRETWWGAYMWAKKNQSLKKTLLSNGSTVIFVLSSTASPEKPVTDSNWITLDEFKVFYTAKWEIRLASGQTRWLTAFCSCPFHQKMFTCKHVVGIAIRMMEVKLPEHIKNAPVVAKRKRGRPCKAKSAYVIQ